MYTRNLSIGRNSSFFLFGPRGTGKSTWTRMVFPKALVLDLLDSDLFTRLLAAPNRLREFIPAQHTDWVVLDEIQKVPMLLDEVHRLIEERHLLFALTGSSARKLRQGGVNLLGGRALSRHMHPLTVQELGEDFSLSYCLRFGCLPSVFGHSSPETYLSGYVATYLKEEVQQEGLTRNLGAFTRFLEAASFSQGSVLNMSEVARDCSVDRKVVENYFTILDDLLLARRLPVFARRAKRRLVQHAKFYFFDAGVYRAIRPSGPLDSPEEIDGIALETLVLQQIQATIDNLELDCQTYFWRTVNKQEVDFVVYGKTGLLAIEVKRASRISNRDLSGLIAFKAEYPSAALYLFYGGAHRMQQGDVQLIPVEQALRELPEILATA